MPSPPKPWERANGNQTTTTQQASTPGTNATSAPAVPARPSSMSTGFSATANRSYGSYGSGSYGSGSYGSGYSPYGGYSGMGSYGGYSPYSRYGSYSTYSPYNRYGGGYGTYNTYNTPYNRFGGYGGGGMMGPGNPDEMSLTQRMEASTSAGFHMVESVVNAFGGFATMLESTFFATHSSFMAMIGVVEQFGNLRNYLGEILSVFALIRWIRKIFYQMVGKAPPSNPQELTPSNFEQFQETRKSRRPLLFFILVVFGLPFLMSKFIQLLSRRRAAEIQNAVPSSDYDNNSGEITRQDSSTPTNFEFCRALYDFRGEFPTELSFARGDIIAILSKTDVWGQPSQWWRGRLRNGEQGMFPSNYVEIIVKSSSNSE